MADSVSWIGTFTNVVGTFMKAGAQNRQMSQQSNVLNYDADVMARNAGVAQQQAQSTQISGDIQTQNIQRQYAQLMGTQRATYGASGVEIGSGSPLQVLEDQASQAERDASISRYNTAVGVSKATNEATNLNAQSALMREEADYTDKARPWTVGSTLLTGLGNAAYRYGLGKARGKQTYDPLTD